MTSTTSLSCPRIVTSDTDEDVDDEGGGKLAPEKTVRTTSWWRLELPIVPPVVSFDIPDNTLRKLAYSRFWAYNLWNCYAEYFRNILLNIISTWKSSNNILKFKYLIWCRALIRSSLTCWALHWAIFGNKTRPSLESSSYLNDECDFEIAWSLGHLDLLTLRL